MDLSFWFQGLLIGFSIAAPVGPISLLCIRRTLDDGRLFGLFTGLGAATADAIYGCIAGFGLTFLSALLIHQQIWFRIIGGIFLCYLGLKAFLTEPSEEMASVKGSNPLGAYASTFFLTLTNPMTILAFAAIFAGLGGGIGGNYVVAVVFVMGVFLGSMLWWLILVGSVSVFRTKLTPPKLHWVNRFSGLILVGFGVFVFLQIFLSS